MWLVVLQAETQVRLESLLRPLKKLRRFATTLLGTSRLMNKTKAHLSKLYLEVAVLTSHRLLYSRNVAG